MMTKYSFGSGATLLAVLAGCGGPSALTTGSQGDGDAAVGAVVPPPVSGTDAGTVEGGASPIAQDAGLTADAGHALDGGTSCASSDPIGANGTYMPQGATVACGTRDPFTWPFAKNSIWNMPIGSGATYVDAKLGTLGAIIIDNDLVDRESPSDPAHEEFRPDHAYGSDGKGGSGEYLHIPDSFVYKAGPNNGAAFFDPDGHTIYEFSAFARDPAGSDPTGWPFGVNQVTGDGTIGGHAGAGMSAVGGTLRPGELTGTAPIRHALKVEFDWDQLSPDWPGKFRWPALNSDSFGNNTYSGTVKALTMGSLVAIKADVDVDAMKWSTPIAQKIAHALQDYGAYVVDTSGQGWKPNGGYAWNLCMQNESISEVKASPAGSDFFSSAGWSSDMSAIYSILAVVDNNTPANIGGGGTLRQPLAPDFAAGTLDAGAPDAGH